MITLYQYHPSGNCYKVRLAFNQLGIPYETVEIDLKTRDEKSRSMLMDLSFARVPSLRLDNGDFLAESNAILWYFAKDTWLCPDTHLEQSKALQWMFWEQYDHEPYLAVIRAWTKFFGVPQGREAEVKFRTERGFKALETMESHLAKTPFFVGERYSIADISLFAYTHVAPEGGFDLKRFPNILKWIERVKQQENYIGISK